MNGLRLGLLTSIWAALLWGALSIRNLPGDWGHFLCGTWGCGPPLQALLACHLSWLLVLLAPVAAIARSPGIHSRTKIRLGVGVALAGFIGLSGVVVHESVSWLPHAGEWQHRYFWHRCGFVIATAVDFPAIQALVCGIWLARRGRVRQMPPLTDVNQQAAARGHAHSKEALRWMHRPPAPPSLRWGQRLKSGSRTQGRAEQP